jgi:hydroxyacyl-ACP dehydratase HTD2-like protein with hotdog domain
VAEPSHRHNNGGLGYRSCASRKLTNDANGTARIWGSSKFEALKELRRNNKDEITSPLTRIFSSHGGNNKKRYMATFR